MSDLMTLCDFLEFFFTDEPTSQGEREKDTADPGVIVGIVAGVVVGMVVAIIVTVVMCRRRGCLPQSQEKRYTQM